MRLSARTCQPGPPAALLRLGHLTILTQFIEPHAFENGVSALFCAGAAGRTHKHIGDAIVRENLVCHSVLSRVVDAEKNLCSILQRVQVFPANFIGHSVKLISPIVTAREDQGVIH
jgi:hypothetical protein